MADPTRPGPTGNTTVDRHKSLTNQLKKTLALYEKSILEEVELLLSQPMKKLSEKGPNTISGGGGGGGGMPEAPIMPVATLPARSDVDIQSKERMLPEIRGDSSFKFQSGTSDYGTNTDNLGTRICCEDQESDLLDGLFLNATSPTVSTEKGIGKSVISAADAEDSSHSGREVAHIQHQSDDNWLGPCYNEESYDENDENDEYDKDDNDMDDGKDEDYMPPYRERRPRHKQIDHAHNNHDNLMDDDGDDDVVSSRSGHNPATGKEADDVAAEAIGPISAPQADPSNEEEEISIPGDRQQRGDTHPASLLPSTASALSRSQPQSGSRPQPQSQSQQHQTPPAAAAGGCCNCLKVLRDQTEVASASMVGDGQKMHCYGCYLGGASAKARRKLLKDCEAEFQSLNSELGHTERRLCSHCRRIWAIGVFYQKHGQGPRLFRQCQACRDAPSKYFLRKAARLMAATTYGGGDAAAAPEAEGSASASASAPGKDKRRASDTIVAYKASDKTEILDEEGGGATVRDLERSGSTHSSHPGSGAPALTLPPPRTREASFRTALSPDSTTAAPIATTTAPIATTTAPIATTASPVATTTHSTEAREEKTANPLAQQETPHRSNKRRLSLASPTTEPLLAAADRNKKLKSE
ncbi:hypothetical protein SLS62_006675 [Diatrype stigma]|uniref:Uncharacterized protein n=1 Tax=Diatrype stigma TaxID=117547 RepID=A0AAN9UMC4_9PEZI